MRLRGWRVLRRIGTCAIACGLTSLAAIAAPQGVATPPGARQPDALGLGRYPPGTRPPEFSGRTVEGHPVSLAALRGKVVLLNFWASWCLDCRPEMPVFERLHREFAPLGLTVLGINARERTESVRLYAKELGLTFPLVLDPDGKINALYGVIGLPTTFLIGRDGSAVALAIGPRDWGSPAARSIIQTLLTESGARQEGAR